MHEELQLRTPRVLRAVGVVWLCLTGGTVGAALVFLLLGGARAQDPATGLVFTFAGLLVFGVWPALYLVSTRVETDGDGVLIVQGGSRKRRISWSEIGAFGVHSFCMDGGGPVDPEDRNGLGPCIWVFCRDFDPANLSRGHNFWGLGLRWANFPLPLQWWPYVNRRQRVAELVELRDRLEVLRSVRTVPRPLPEKLAVFLAHHPGGGPAVEVAPCPHAIAIGEVVVADCERLLGPEHPDTLRARANLASSYRSAGRTADAIAVEERVVADSERLLGPEHSNTLRARDQP